MKKAFALFASIFLITSICAQHTWTKVYSYNEYLGLRADSIMTPPGDTLASAPNGSFALKNNHVYQKNSSGIWVQVDGGGNAVQSLTGSQSIQYGAFSAMPTPGTIGRWYGATDSMRWYFDNGTQWLPFGGSGSSSGSMINLGGAPGQLQGTYAAIPAANAYLIGTTYIARDSGFQYVDTGSGLTAGWKRIGGGNTSFTVSTTNSIAGAGTPASPLQFVGDAPSPGNSYYYGTNGSGAKGYYTLPSGVAAANPTAQIGLSTINGTATTFIRSDAAQSLSQGIIPTWTGLHTFNGNLTMGSQFQFSADNTYSVGSVTAGAAHVWSRVFNSDAGVSLLSATGNNAIIGIGSTPGFTLLSTGQGQLNAYITPTTFTGTPTFVLEGDASGHIIQGSIGGADSAVLAGFGILKQVSGTNISILTDTTLSYFIHYVVTGLNNQIVGDGNSNSVGFNNPPGTGTNIPNSYPTKSFNALGGTAAGYTVQVLGVPSQTTQQMITNAPSVIDPQYNASFTHNYLYAWEMENDIQINGIYAFQAVTNMNNYYTARNGVGWRTVGATALPKTAGSGYDSTLFSTIDSANRYLINNHTSNLFINFRTNPWLNNNMSRAGFGPDYIHMNASGTQVMADSFSYYIKRDQGQSMPYPAHPVFWNGNITDRTMEIGPLSAGLGVSFMAGGMNVFDVTGSGGISLIGQKQAELSGAPNIAFTIYPSFWNSGGFTGTTNYDISLNNESQWSNALGNKVAFFNPAGSIMNTGFGIDIFANLQPGQSTYYFNSAFGTHAFQGATPGVFNTMVGSLSSDVHTSNGNVFTAAGLAIPAIGNDNTWAGANGSISSGTVGSTTLGYGNTQAANYGIAIGNANNISGTSTHTGGSIAIGYNQNDGGYRGIFIGNLESAAYGNMPTADGQCIIGDIYNGSGYKAINSFFFGGNQALNSGIQAAFAGITMNVPGVAGGSSNTNLSASSEFWQFNGAIATGNALGGAIIFATSQKTTSGTARQTPVKMLRIDADQTVDVGEPATHPTGLNINARVTITADSLPVITPVGTTMMVVQDNVTGLINTAAIPSGGMPFSQITTTGSAPSVSVGSAVPAGGSVTSGSCVPFANAVKGSWCVTAGTGVGTGSNVFTFTIPAQPSSNYVVMFQQVSGSPVVVYPAVLSTTQFQMNLATGSTITAGGSYGWNYWIVN